MGVRGWGEEVDGLPLNVQKGEEYALSDSKQHLTNETKHITRYGGGDSGKQGLREDGRTITVVRPMYTK